MFVKRVSGAWVGRGLGRNMVEGDWGRWSLFSGSRGVGWEHEPRNACQAAVTAAFREVVLLRRVTKKGILKQGMHTKRVVLFFFLHLLLMTPHNSQRKDSGRVCCPCSGKVTGLHPVGGMPFVIFPSTRELAQPGLGKGVFRNGRVRVCFSKAVGSEIVLSLPYLILYLLCDTVYTSMAQISLRAIFPVVPEPMLL